SPNEDLPIGLHGGGGNPLTSTRANVESRVQTSVRVQPGDAVPARAIVAGEISPDDDLLIGLHGGGTDKGTDTRARVETQIQAAVRVQPGDAVPARAIVADEIPPDDDFSIGMNGGGEDAVVRSHAGVEVHVKAAVRVQPGDAVPLRAVVADEGARDQDLHIG